MQVAILDLGSNTFHLLIAEITKPGSYKVLLKKRSVVKLLDGSKSSNLIQAVPFKRGIKAISSFYAEIKKYSVDRTIVLGTSALRTTKNGVVFQAEIKQKTGLEIQIISGDKEAELIYEGVKASLDIGDVPVLILDIGGGSNEFIIANKDQVFWKQSFALGASRMLELFSVSDRVTPEEQATLFSFWDRELQPLFVEAQKYGLRTLVGSSGSFDTFAEVICHRFHHISALSGRTSYDYNMDEYWHISEMLLASSGDQRRATKGLIKMRADLIVVACLFTNFVLQKTHINAMRLSKGALKEGMLRKLSLGMDL